MKVISIRTCRAPFGLKLFPQMIDDYCVLATKTTIIVIITIIMAMRQKELGAIVINVLHSENNSPIYHSMTDVGLQ